jgi:hypothetical protein
MAVRKNLSHPEKVRERIRTSQLVNRLTDHAFGKCEMSATQVTAALGVLKKSLPDLSAVEHSGEIKNRDVSDEPLTAEEWENRYSAPN